MRRPLVSLAMLIAGAALFFAAFSHAGGSSRIRDGGTFRISLQAANFDYVDPALVLLVDPARRNLRTADEPPGQASARQGFDSYPRSLRPSRACPATARPTGSRFAPASASATELRSTRARSHTRSTVFSPRGSTRRPSNTCRTSSAPLQFGRERAATAVGVVADGNRLVVRVHTAALRLRRADGDAVFLRRAADASQRPRGGADLPRIGSVLRLRVRAQPAHRPGTESLLRRHAAAPRRPLRRGPPGEDAPGGARPDRARPGRLGLRGPGFPLLRPGARADPEVRSQPFAVLRQAWARPEGLLPERLAPAVSRQPRVAEGRELRRRPAGDREPGRSVQPPRRPADRPVPAAEHAGLPRRAPLPARRARPGQGAKRWHGVTCEAARQCSGHPISPRRLRLPRSSSRTCKRIGLEVEIKALPPDGVLSRGREAGRAVRHRARQLGGRLRRSLSVHQRPLRRPLRSSGSTSRISTCRSTTR